MTTYRNIHGRSIQSLATDPTESVAEGQIWYNTSSNTFKSVLLSEAWRSASSLNTGRYNLTGVGTDTAGLVFGGDTGPPPETRRAESEEYNGSGWSTTPNMNTTRDLTGGFGIQTAAATAGGRPPSAPGGSNNTEEYNGSSWTAVPGTLNTTRFGAGGFGTQTAGAVCGGTPPTTNATEEYDGSSWTSVNNMNNSVSSLQSATSGTQTAAIRVAGYPNSNTIELYDGTNWTNSPATLNTARFAGSYQGAQTAGFYAGGELFPPNTATAATETWDGTSMSTSSATLALITKYQTGSKGSPSTSGFICGGQTPAATNSAVTQEFNKSENVITAAAWSAGGNMNQGRSGLGACGSKTAGLAIQGETSTNLNNVEEYDGSSWTNATAHPESKQSASVTGLQTAAISLGGYPLVTTSVAYNGSSWTSAPALTVANANWAAGGPSTACFGISGGEAPSPSSGKYHDQYNGSSWTSATNMSTTRVQCAALGAAQDAILATGGRANTPGAPSVRVSTTESWNGSSWTSGPSMIVARSGHLGFGTQTAGIVQAGSTNPGSTNLSSQGRYDGTTFSTGASNAVNHGGGLGGTGGTSAPISANISNCFMCGAPSSGAATEEFNEETSALNVKTLTQS